MLLGESPRRSHSTSARTSRPVTLAVGPEMATLTVGRGNVGLAVMPSAPPLTVGASSGNSAWGPTDSAGDFHCARTRLVEQNAWTKHWAIVTHGPR